MQARARFQTPKTPHLLAWGYTIKACLGRLKALIFVVRLIIADLVPVAAPCAGDGEARKHVLVLHKKISQPTMKIISSLPHFGWGNPAPTPSLSPSFPLSLLPSLPPSPSPSFPLSLSHSLFSSLPTARLRTFLIKLRNFKLVCRRLINSLIVVSILWGFL